MDEIVDKKYLDEHLKVKETLKSQESMELINFETTK